MEISTYPNPPGHYVKFEEGPTAMQPPDIGCLGATYRMFGQVVQNPCFGDNAKLNVPLIDKDMMMYDPKLGIKAEVVRMIDTLPVSVVGLLKAIQNTPNQAHKELRDFDARIKSLFHALEQLRPVEAKETVVKMCQDEIVLREEANRKCQEAINDIESLLS